MRGAPRAAKMMGLMRMIGSMSSNPTASQAILRIAPTGRYKRLFRKLSGWYVTVQIPESNEEEQRGENRQSSDKS